MVGDLHSAGWNALKPRGLRAIARHGVLSASGLLDQITGRSAAALRCPRVQILILHHIFPDEEDRFRRVLQFLQESHTFVSYSEAIRRIEAGEIDKPYISFTFDDGFKNCLRAADIMNEFGARGCFFVCPSIIGEANGEKIARFCRDRLQLPITIDFMNWDDLAGLRDAGHEVGGHTMTHANLARVSPAEARDEIAGSYDSIKQILGDVRHFTWTFGQFHDFTPAAARAVFEVGYSSCASGVRGSHGPHRPMIEHPCIRRDHIIAASPLSHLNYFLTRSSRRLSAANADWPQGWNV